MEWTSIPLSKALAGSSSAHSPFRVIIPAHNEEAVIGRCLSAIIEPGIDTSHLEVMVVANGCSDRTAQIAQSFGEAVRIVETPIASKSLAINLGLDGVHDRPCLVVDADVISSFQSLQATADVLASGAIRAASPRLKIDLSQADKVVSAYYRVWQALPYAKDRLIGGGVYGLSADAVKSMGPLPDLIADDLFVRSRFAFDQRQTVTETRSGADVFTEMFPPRTARELIFIEARRWHGTRQLRRTLARNTTLARNGLPSALRNTGQDYGLVDLAIYLTVKMLGRALFLYQETFGQSGWNRDDSTRTAE